MLTERKRDNKKSSVKLERGQRAEARKRLGQRKDASWEESGAHLQKQREREKMEDRQRDDGKEIAKAEKHTN